MREDIHGRDSLTALAASQAQWVQSLYRADATLSRGMLVYQSNMLALAKSCLHSAYPVLTAVLGTESMDALASAHWLQLPPQRGDVHQWGGALADFMQAQPQLASWPWLPDVARCEWAMHRLAFAADGVAAQNSLQHLVNHEPERLLLHLAPGWQTLHSAWPVLDIVHTHRQLPMDAIAQADCLQALWSRVHTCNAPDGGSAPVLLWRQGWQPQLRACIAGEEAFLHALGRQASLHDALLASPLLAIDQWLPLAVQTGLLLQVSVAAEATDSPIYSGEKT